MIGMGFFLTGVRLWFKTMEPDGLILFAGSEGIMEEFIVIQFRVGRPRLIFDTQGHYKHALIIVKLNLFKLDLLSRC